VEGTNKAHENGEAMGFVGVRLTVMLGAGFNIIAIENRCHHIQALLALQCFNGLLCLAQRCFVDFAMALNCFSGASALNKTLYI
jgi:hypothetical protein